MKLLIALLLAAPIPTLCQTMYYDDFNDNYIGDWMERCGYGNWTASSGQAHCQTGNTCSALVCPGCLVAEDVSVSIRGTATHVLGVVARLDEGDTGIYAYVSPDHDVARIRKVVAGNTSTIYSSLAAAFPSGVYYELEFICEGDELTLCIDVPSTGQSWILEATDPAPQPGEIGLAAGDEPYASFDWFSAIGISGVGIESLATDDDMTGESSGNGNMAFQAGETIELTIGLASSGNTTLTDVMAVLQSLSPTLVVTDDYETYPDLDPGQIVECDEDFGVTCSPASPENATYPMRLTVFAAGGFSEQLEFDLPLGCGIVCNVEGSSPDEWAHSALTESWLDNWHVSNLRNHTPGGTQSFKCGDTGSGDYDNLLYCAESSPWFNVPIGGDLSFWMWIDAQEFLGEASSDALDGGLIRMGQFDNWIQLEPTGGYPYQIVSTMGPFAQGTDVFSGTYGWQLVVVDLPDSLAGPRQLRFVFGSDDAGTREGWYIDDVYVTGGTGVEDPGGSSPVLPLSLRAFPNPSYDNVTLQVTGGAPGAEITVFDMSGRIVTRLVPLPQGGSATASTTWDWTDCSGVPVPPGVYIARCLTPQGEEQSLRMVRTR